MCVYVYACIILTNMCGIILGKKQKTKKFYTREVWVRQKEEGEFIERRREMNIGQAVGKICALINPFWPKF